MTRQLKLDLLKRCAILLMAAVILRNLPGWTSLLLRQAEKTPAASQAHTAAPGQPESTLEPVPEPESETALPPLRYRDLPPEPEPSTATPEPLPVFRAEDAGEIVIRGNCTLDYDKTALLLRPLAVTPPQDGPQILIVHTHSTEAFVPEPGWEYEETELCRTLDPEHSVIRLGAEIASVLESFGISVLHDQTINDYPSYAGSYDRMEAIIQTYLEQYPSIRMVLDVHRDAFEEADGSLGGTAEEGRARVMLVTGTNQGGLHHPNWEDNLSFALKLEVLLQQDSPGMSKGISLCTQRYNQHLTPLSLLAEFGAAGDTLQEAIAAARDFARSLARLLQ